MRFQEGNRKENIQRLLKMTKTQSEPPFPCMYDVRVYVLFACFSRLLFRFFADI